jgi:hypothetical protein
MIRERLPRLGMFMLVLSGIVVLVCGCSTAGTSSSSEKKAGPEYSIRGELVEVEKNGTGDAIGLVVIEGARSSEVDEATLYVTNGTRIVDQRSGHDEPAGFGTLVVHQTVEAEFVYTGKTQSVGRALSIAVCP